MKKKINSILLIDDNDADNFYNNLIIKKLDCSIKVTTLISGQAALDFFQSKFDDEHPQPDLVFLDINMPAMNGWEFLDHYLQLNDREKTEVIIVMLSASLNPDDREMAETYSCINGFINKPLSEKSLKSTIDKYFSD